MFATVTTHYPGAIPAHVFPQSLNRPQCNNMNGFTITIGVYDVMFIAGCSNVTTCWTCSMDDWTCSVCSWHEVDSSRGCWRGSVMRVLGDVNVRYKRFKKFSAWISGFYCSRLDAHSAVDINCWVERGIQRQLNRRGQTQVKFSGQRWSVGQKVNHRGKGQA